MHAFLHRSAKTFWSGKTRFLPRSSRSKSRPWRSLQQRRGPFSHWSREHLVWLIGFPYHKRKGPRFGRPVSLDQAQRISHLEDERAVWNLAQSPKQVSRKPVGSLYLITPWAGGPPVSSLPRAEPTSPSCESWPAPAACLRRRAWC